MSPGGSRLAVAAATVVVVAAAGWGAAVDEWSVVIVSVGGGFAVGVGWLVVTRDPTSPVGPALAWSTAAIAAVSAHVGPLVGLPWSTGIWPLNLAGLLALLLVFPDGPLPGRRWRWVSWAFGAATVGMVTAEWGITLTDGRLVGGSGGVWRAPLAAVCALTVAACLTAGVASLVHRHRHGNRRTGQQIRWLALAGLVVLVLLVGGWVAQTAGTSVEASFTPFLVAILVLVPAAVGVAIVRHDLFDVDRLLTGTAAWLVTVVVAAVIFGAVVAGIGYAVSAGTGVSTTIAAFVTALAVLPLERHVAAWVGRVVDRDRYVAVATVERFAADVRAGTRQPEEIETVLREVQDDPDLIVAVLGPSGSWMRLDGTTVTGARGVDLTVGDEVVARIVLGWDTTRARRRLADVAKAAWVPVEVSRLRLGLREAVAEAEASRHRLAQAAAAERRRLERDLHDGAQQRIIATGMRLRLLQERLPEDLALQVDTAVHELQGTVEQLRTIAHGVRPGQLDDGLAAALDGIRRTTPLPVEVETGELPDVGDVRLLTTYLVVAEAVANVLKHARASSIRIRVTAAETDDRLRVEVRDDGIGGVPGDAALPALRDRVLSVGGTLRVSSTPGCGTTVTAVL